MLSFLEGKAGERRLRLYAVACCRHAGHLLADLRCRAALEAVERYADDPSGAGELLRARCEAQRPLWDVLPPAGVSPLPWGRSPSPPGPTPRLRGPPSPGRWARP